MFELPSSQLKTPQKSCEITIALKASRIRLTQIYDGILMGGPDVFVSTNTRLLTRVKAAIEKGPQPQPPKKRAVEMLPAPAAAKLKGRHQQAKDAVGGGRQVQQKQGGAVHGVVGGPQSHTKVLSSPPPAANGEKATHRRKETPAASPVRGEDSPPGQHGGEQSSASPYESHSKSDERRRHPPGGRGVEGEADYHHGGGGGGGGMGGLGMQGGDQDLRQLLLDMANYNLGQFDLHR